MWLILGLLAPCVLIAGTFGYAAWVKGAGGSGATWFFATLLAALIALVTVPIALFLLWRDRGYLNVLNLFLTALGGLPLALVAYFIVVLWNSPRGIHF